ncbi:MAG: DUF1573 domain-containing protein [Bacteroidota bacterium]
MKKLPVFLIVFLFLVTSAIAQKAKIRFEKTVHDFGQIVEKGGNRNYRFIFTNTGDVPVVITKVIASCGCTTPGWTREVIEPGKTGFVNVSYNPTGHVGPLEKTVTVISNAQPELLLIKGEVVSVDLAPVPLPDEYIQYFPYNKNVILASDSAFSTFVKKLLPRIDKTGVLNIAIESSASHVPTKKYKTNEILTETRAEEAKEKMIEVLTKKGVDRARLNFETSKTLIQGPAYRKDSKENMDEYEKYQYIRITVL